MLAVSGGSTSKDYFYLIHFSLNDGTLAGMYQVTSDISNAMGVSNFGTISARGSNSSLFNRSV